MLPRGTVTFSTHTIPSLIHAPTSKTKQYALITLSNLPKRNALSLDMMHDLSRAVDAIERESKRNEKLVAVVVTGTGGTFCSGFDLSTPSTLTSTFARQMTTHMHKTLVQLHRLPLISIAAVDGHALGGGCELMTWCDIRVMAHGAKGGYLQTRMGVTTGWGGATRARQILGPVGALGVLTTPRVMTAHECLRKGLITHIGNEGETAIEAVERHVFSGWADAYAGAMRGFKRVLGEGGRDGEVERLLGVEAEVFCGLWGGEDNLEAVRGALGGKKGGKSRL
ncbi:hypothetical protein HDU98_009496 [Podochytrium sp. JEL0797]|nr:hypothetical protein HDU98_009496 [Podochytrium sp. JEL0797]